MLSVRAISVFFACLPRLVASAAQAPFVAEDGASDWTTPPDEDTTAHNLFSSMSSLLQVWPNTIFRNSHTAVPATVPAGTTLYHGTFFPTPPTNTFEWLAFDFELSYIFNKGNNGSHVYKYAASRDLQLLYIEGGSASKCIGAMHLQDVLLYGEVPEPTRDWDEMERSKALCEWGAPLGLDGFLRMNFAFEILFCNFSSGITVIDHVRPLPKTLPDDPDRFPVFPGNYSTVPPPGWEGSLPSTDEAILRAIVAGAWHNHAPGETRARAHRHLAVSFYDPALLSLRDVHHNLPRARHSLANISRADAHAKVAEIEGVVRDWRSGKAQGSGADWASALRQVEERYGARLLELNHTLHSDGAYTNTSAHATAARQLVLIMLVPYMAAADFADAAPNTTSWLAPAMARCGAQATGGLRAVLPIGSFTRQERAIMDAIEGTEREICRVLGLVWLDAMGVESAEEDAAGALVVRWRMLVDELLAWLDWASFRTCRPGCAADERCYVPTPPYLQPGDDPNDFSFQPRCIKLQAPRRSDRGWDPTRPPYMCWPEPDKP